MDLSGKLLESLWNCEFCEEMKQGGFETASRFEEDGWVNLSLTLFLIFIDCLMIFLFFFFPVPSLSNLSCPSLHRLNRPDLADLTASKNVNLFDPSDFASDL